MIKTATISNQMEIIHGLMHGYNNYYVDRRVRKVARSTFFYYCYFCVPYITTFCQFCVNQQDRPNFHPSVQKMYPACA